jgi:hypothetical protein
MQDPKNVRNVITAMLFLQLENVLSAFQVVALRVTPATHHYVPDVQLVSNLQEQNVSDVQSNAWPAPTEFALNVIMALILFKLIHQ